jgi:hypothetical protein
MHDLFVALSLSSFLCTHDSFKKIIIMCSPSIYASARVRCMPVHQLFELYLCIFFIFIFILLNFKLIKLNFG